MLTQLLLNFLVYIIADFVQLIPPLPPAWATGLAGVTSGGSYVASKLAVLSPVVPWGVVWSIMQAWVGAVVFWAACLAVKAVLWAVGR